MARSRQKSRLRLGRALGVGLGPFQANVLFGEPLRSLAHLTLERLIGRGEGGLLRSKRCDQ